LKSNQFVGTRQPEAVDGGSRWRGGRTEHEAPAGTVGTDESGKGDYFGPLVVAGVCVPAGGREVLAALGVRDSKTLSDGQVERLARAVREAYPIAVVAIGPERYNALYAKVGNLNRLLAWAHARVIENLLERIPECREAISDQFGDALEQVLDDTCVGPGEQPVQVAHLRVERVVALGADRHHRGGIGLPHGAGQALDLAVGQRLAVAHAERREHLAAAVGDVHTRHHER